MKLVQNLTTVLHFGRFVKFLKLYEPPRNIFSSIKTSYHSECSLDLYLHTRKSLLKSGTFLESLQGNSSELLQVFLIELAGRVEIISSESAAPTWSSADPRRRRTSRFEESSTTGTSRRAPSWVRSSHRRKLSDSAGRIRRTDSHGRCGRLCRRSENCSISKWGRRNFWELSMHVRIRVVKGTISHPRVWKYSSLDSEKRLTLALSEGR